MKRTVIAAVILSLGFAAAAFAAGSIEPTTGSGPNFEQRKAEILQFLEERISKQEQEKACVEAATNHDDLKVCREKYGPPHHMGGPGGPGRSGGHGGPGGQALHLSDLWASAMRWKLSQVIDPRTLPAGRPTPVRPIISRLHPDDPI